MGTAYSQVRGTIGSIVMPPVVEYRAGRPSNVASVSDSTLQTIESSLEDLRSLVTCRICVKLLYEPYTIQCGHTFCYSCLAQWFRAHNVNKTCPDCRAGVSQQPAPAYVVSNSSFIEQRGILMTTLLGSRDDKYIYQSGRAPTSRRNHRRSQDMAIRAGAYRRRG